MLAPKLREALNEWGLKLTEKLKAYLRSGQGNPPSAFKASGRTADSVSYKVAKERGEEKIGLRFYSEGKKPKYGIVDLINKGQAPSGSKRLPPRTDIQQWIQNKGITLRYVNKKGKLVSPANNEKNIKRASYLISRSIRRKGAISRFGRKGSNVYVTLFGPEQAKMTEDFSKAFQLDLQAHITKEAKKNSNVN